VTNGVIADFGHTKFAPNPLLIWGPMTGQTSKMNGDMDNESLVLDLVEWVATSPRSYADVMSAWRTTCPRMSIWEDSLDERLVSVHNDTVYVTTRGSGFLKDRGRVGR